MSPASHFTFAEFLIGTLALAIWFLPNWLVKFAHAIKAIKRPSGRALSYSTRGRVMSFLGDEDDWQSYAGYMPLIRAEYQLRNLRRVSGRLLGLHGEIMEELHSEQNDYLEMLQKDPKGKDFIYEGRMFAEEEILNAADELPILLFGSLVVYGFSLLEAALAGCVDTAAHKRGIPIPRRIVGPKIDGWVAFLIGECGLRMNWGQLAKELDFWRRARNAYVHELSVEWDSQRTHDLGVQLNDVTQVSEFLVLIESALMMLDNAMCGL